MYEGRKIGGGKYVLEKQLGEGAMGQVYEALQVGLARKVAIKVLSRDLLSQPNQNYLKRLIDEAKAASKVTHRSLVQLLDAGSDKELGPFIVYELLTGHTLDRDIMQRGPTKWNLVYRKVARSVLPALAALHEAGIIHRDVKPANLFIDENGNYKLGDFGLAHFHGRVSKTMTGTTVGTPYYLPPEHLADPTLEVTPGLDIYSAALMMVEAVYGSLPFRELIHKMTFAPKADELETKGFPKEVAKLFEAALSLDPDQRPTCARTWLKELDRASKGSSLAISKVDLRPLEEQRRAPIGILAVVVIIALLGARFLFGPQKPHQVKPDTRLAEKRLVELREELLNRASDGKFQELGVHLQQAGMDKKLVPKKECSPVVLGRFYLAHYYMRKKNYGRALNILCDLLKKEGPFVFDDEGKTLLSLLEKECRSKKEREKYIAALGDYLKSATLKKRHDWIVKEYLRQLVILGDRHQRTAFFEMTNSLFSEPLPDITNPSLRMHAAYLMAYGLDPSAIELVRAHAWSQRALAKNERKENIWPFRYQALFILLKCPVESFTGPKPEIIDHVEKKVDEYLDLAPPEHVEQMLLLAKIWVKTYHSKSAVKDMDIVDVNKIEQDEKWRYHRMRGEILKDKAQHEEMMVEFKKAIALAPKERHHHLNHVMKANSFFFRGAGPSKKSNSARVSE